MDRELRVVEIEDLRVLMRYREQWDSLARAMEWPFAELHWVVAAAEHLERGRRVLAVIVEQGERLVGAILLAVGVLDRRSFLGPVGFDALGDSQVLLAETPDVLSTLIEHLIRRGQPLVLPRVLHPGGLDAALKNISKSKGILIPRRAAGSPMLDLRGGVEQVKANLSGNRRNAMRRKLKKLRMMGSVRFGFVAPSETEVRDYLGMFEKLEDRGWKGEKGSSIARKKGFHDFFLDGLMGFARDARVRFDYLSLDERIVAIQMGTVSGGRYFLLKPTYDETLAVVSPGQLLTYAAIEQSALDGLSSYEFLGAEDGWKLRWANSVRDARTWVYYPYSPGGAVALSKDVLRRLFG